jgi:hypothetical protein
VKSAEEIGAATLARLARQTARNRAAGNALDEVIRDILAAEPRLTARQVLERLPPEWGWCSLRTAQLHLQRIRGGFDRGNRDHSG